MTDPRQIERWEASDVAMREEIAALREEIRIVQALHDTMMNERNDAHAEVERLRADLDAHRIALREAVAVHEDAYKRLRADPRMALTANELRHALDCVRAWADQEPESSGYARQMEARIRAAAEAVGTDERDRLRGILCTLLALHDAEVSVRDPWDATFAEARAALGTDERKGAP